MMALRAAMSSRVAPQTRITGHAAGMCCQESPAHAQVPRPCVATRVYTRSLRRHGRRCRCGSPTLCIPTAGPAPLSHSHSESTVHAVQREYDRRREAALQKYGTEISSRRMRFPIRLSLLELVDHVSSIIRSSSRCSTRHTLAQRFAHASGSAGRMRRRAQAHAAPTHATARAHVRRGATHACTRTNSADQASARHGGGPWHLPRPCLPRRCPR